MAPLDEQHTTNPPRSEGVDWSLSEHLASAEKKALFVLPAISKPSSVGRYKILDCIGHGGMGIVYLAQHPVSQQKVALKVLLPLRATPQVIGNFLVEIRRLAKFNHSRIATIFDADTFESENGPLPYFTMQFIEGAKPVTTYAREALCDYQRCLELISHTASAVAEAHKLEVIHGDIKPSNVLVGLDGELKVVDFGASMELCDSASTLRAMTPAYAAPEQLGELRLAIQSDVFSLAVLRPELIAGRRPFESARSLGTATVLDGKLVSLRRLNRNVAKKIEMVILHSLAQRPEDRYSDAGAFGRD